MISFCADPIENKVYYEVSTHFLSAKGMQLMHTRIISVKFVDNKGPAMHSLTV
jgi:hypothetical protein